MQERTSRHNLGIMHAVAQAGRRGGQKAQLRRLERCLSWLSLLEVGCDM